MFKNVASQKVIVFAWDNANGVPKTGDAANITARISKEGVDSAASNDVNPTEISATTHKGLYKFNMLIAETNCDLFGLTAVSATADIDISPVIIYTKDLGAEFTKQMTESYAADGVAPTPAQALFLIQQVLTQFAIADVTLTIKKLDGTTTAAVLTLDDAINPTQADRTA